MISVSINDFLYIISFLVSPVVALAIFIARKDANIRWFLMVLLTAELVDEAMHDTALSWGEMYYIFGMASNALIITLILFRKYTASYFAHGFMSSENNFFKRAYKGYKFKLQEGGIIGLCVISFFICLGFVIEGILYKSWVIDSLPYRDFVYSPVQTILHLLTAVAAITLALNSQQKKGKLT